MAMKEFRIRLLKVSLLSVIIVLGATPGLAVQVTAGWTHADVGLQNEGDGFFVGVGNEIFPGPAMSSMLPMHWNTCRRPAASRRFFPTR